MYFSSKNGYPKKDFPSQNWIKKKTFIYQELFSCCVVIVNVFAFKIFTCYASVLIGFCFFKIGRFWF